MRAVIDVVFIGGYGRSGSTLLHRLLGSIPGFVAVGELRHVWERGYGDDQLCGCGTPFRSCPFWKAVTVEAFGSEIDVAQARRIFALKRSVERPRRTHQIRLGLAGAPYRRRRDAYLRILADLYAAVATVSGARVIVDSTKDPTHGFALARTAGVRLRTVHLVRDSRATVHSWLRRRERPEVHWRRELMPVVHPVDAALRWSAANVLTELLRGIGGGYVRLRYEDLAADPANQMRALLDRLGLGGTPTLLDGGAADLPQQHTVSGNPLRFADGPVTITPDLEWRTAMPAGRRRLVTALTAPLLLRYGYLSIPWRSPRDRLTRHRGESPPPGGSGDSRVS